MTMSFRIEYTTRRPARVVAAGHFERSRAFAPVLRMAVGESTPPGRYVSAGYRRITRIA
jgi:hypothetical protein